MEKKLKITLGVILGLIILFMVVSYLLTGRMSMYSRSCGTGFNQEIKSAIEREDTSFCSELGHSISYARDPIYGKYRCRPYIFDEYYIRKDDFKDSCLRIFAERLDNPEICTFLDGGSNRDSCILSFARAREDMSICELMSKNYDNAYYKICIMNKSWTPENKIEGTQEIPAA
jgi:hypothetical protein